MGCGFWCLIKVSHYPLWQCYCQGVYCHIDLVCGNLPLSFLQPPSEVESNRGSSFSPSIPTFFNTLLELWLYLFHLEAGLEACGQLYPQDYFCTLTYLPWRSNPLAMTGVILACYPHQNHRQCTCHNHFPTNLSKDHYQDSLLASAGKKSEQEKSCNNDWFFQK